MASGTACGMVVATAGATELGHISGLLQQTASLETPLTRALAKVGGAITIGILAVTVVLLAVGVWRLVGQGVSLGVAVREMLIFAISLAVGAIPEGLPAIVTIALAVGVQRMARRRAIIRKLPAVETLGSTSVICSDKTGTLTRNEMTVQALWAGGEPLEVDGIGWRGEGGFRLDGQVTAPSPAARRLMEAAALCSDATVEAAGEGWEVTGDPTEAALVVVARKAGLEAAALRAAQPRLDAIPFESEHQYMATLHQSPGRPPRLLMKGAPEVVVARCQADGRAAALAAAGGAHGARPAGAGGGRASLARAGRGPRAGRHHRRLRAAGAGGHDRPSAARGGRGGGGLPHRRDRREDDHRRSRRHGARGGRASWGCWGRRARR